MLQSLCKIKLNTHHVHLLSLLGLTYFLAGIDIIIFCDGDDSGLLTAVYGPCAGIPIISLFLSGHESSRESAGTRYPPASSHPRAGGWLRTPAALGIQCQC